MFKTQISHQADKQTIEQTEEQMFEFSTRITPKDMKFKYKKKLSHNDEVTWHKRHKCAAGLKDPKRYQKIVTLDTGIWDSPSFLHNHSYHFNHYSS